MIRSFVPVQGVVRRLLTSGIAATALVVSACSQVLRLPPAPPATEIPDLERRVVENVTDLQVLARLGAAYWSSGRMDEAERILPRVGELDSRHPAPAFFPGVTCEEMGRWSEARQAFERCLELEEAGGLQAGVLPLLVLLHRREVEEAARASLAEEPGAGDRTLDPAAVGLLPFPSRGPDQGLRPLGRETPGCRADGGGKRGRGRGVSPHGSHGSPSGYGYRG